MHTDTAIGRMRVCLRCQSRYDDALMEECPRDGSPLIEILQTPAGKSRASQEIQTGRERCFEAPDMADCQPGPGQAPGDANAAMSGDHPGDVPGELVDALAALMADGNATQTGGEQAAAPAEQPPEHRVGEVLGSYRLLELIGQGGMGWVYRAEHVKLGRQVALKLLRADRAGRRDAVARFFQEARTVNRIRHRNLIDITDLVELDDGTTFIIMELLIGLTLGEWRRANQEETGRALDIVVQICDGLAAVHGLGVVHRDLKPDNIIIVPTAEGDLVKLLDFGIAKLMSDEEPGPDTEAGTMLGTPAYMSPEQAGGSPVDARSDIYSLGVLLYEMFTRERVFRGRCLGEYVRKHLNVVPRLPSETRHGADIDPRLEAIIMRCLAKQPEDRYGSADELRDALATLRSFEHIVFGDERPGETGDDRDALAQGAASVVLRPSGALFVEAPGATPPAPALYRSGPITENGRIPAANLLLAARPRLPWVIAGVALMVLVYRSWEGVWAPSGKQQALPASAARVQVSPGPRLTMAEPATASAAAGRWRAPAQHAVHLDSMPSAEVRLVGSELSPCRTPCVLEVPPGTPEGQLAFQARGYYTTRIPFDPADPALLVYTRLEEIPRNPPAFRHADGARSGARLESTAGLEQRRSDNRSGEPRMHPAEKPRKRSRPGPQRSEDTARAERGKHQHADHGAPTSVHPTETLDPFGGQ